MPAKKKPVPKPFNNGSWTQARFNSFVKSALRKAKWPPKYQAIRKAYVRDGVNPATGRRCKLHQCCECHELFPQKDMRADHIEPVVPIEGFTSWDDIIARLFVNTSGFQALCTTCHGIKTKAENEARRAHKKAQKEKENVNADRSEP